MDCYIASGMLTRRFDSTEQYRTGTGTFWYELKQAQTWTRERDMDGLVKINYYTDRQEGIYVTTKQYRIGRNTQWYELEQNQTWTRK